MLDPASYVFCGRRVPDIERLYNERARPGIATRQFSTVNRSDANPFFRDAQRILHSAFFRNLQRKSFSHPSVGEISFRTALTHTMEVASVAVGAALHLGLDQNLTLAISLGAFLGTPVYGELGRDIFDKHARELGWDKFPTPFLSLWLVTLGPSEYPEHEGLNLTMETLNGIFTSARSKSKGKEAKELMAALPPAIRALSEPATLEACLVRAVVPIVKCAHSIDDMLKAEAIDTAVAAQLFRLAFFDKIEIVKQYLHRALPDLEFLDCLRANRTTLVRQIIRAGRMEAIEDSRSGADLRRWAGDDAELEELGKLIREAYSSLPFIVATRAQARRHITAAHRAAQSRFGNTMRALFEVARLNDDACRLLALQDGEDSDSPLVRAIHDSYLISGVPTSRSVLLNKILSYLRDLSGTWSLMAGSTGLQGEWVVQEVCAESGRVADVTFNWPPGSAPDMAAKNLIAVKSSECDNTLREVAERFGRTEWILGFKVESDLKSASQLFLIPWPSANLAEGRIAANCMREIAESALRAITQAGLGRENESLHKAWQEAEEKIDRLKYENWALGTQIESLRDARDQDEVAVGPVDPTDGDHGEIFALKLPSVMFTASFERDLLRYLSRDRREGRRILHLCNLVASGRRPGFRMRDGVMKYYDDNFRLYYREIGGTFVFASHWRKHENKGVQTQHITRVSADLDKWEQAPLNRKPVQSQKPAGLSSQRTG